MRLKGFFCAVCIVACHSHAEENRVEGRVVDENGRPVSAAAVSPFWRANGSAKRPDGTDYDLYDHEQNAAFWGNVGDMQPFQTPVESSKDGTFSITLGPRNKHLLAMNASRTQGGILQIPADGSVDGHEIRLGPLVTVTARLKSIVPGKSIDWSHVYVELAPDPTQPLAMRRVVSCGSYESRFECRLPPGSYRLDVYGNSNRHLETNDLRARSTIVLAIDGTESEIDLGTIELADPPPDRQVLEKAAKDAGRWRDFREHYGESAPDWHAVDARGISKQSTIRDFRGKWLLIHFWGLGCAPCLSDGVPKMMEFYEAHANKKDRFEIVGVCIDIHDEVADLEELDVALAPVITHVWQGRKIEYPIVLDDTFQTWERFGIQGLGDLVLIDPDGNIVEGDESTLGRILEEPAVARP